MILYSLVLEEDDGGSYEICLHSREISSGDEFVQIYWNIEVAWSHISRIEVKSNIWILNYVRCQMRHRRESFIANVTLYTPTPALYWRDKHSLPNHVFFISHYSYQIIAILFILIRIDRIRAHERFQSENKYLNIHKHISFSLLYYVKIVIVNTYFEILVWGIYRVDQKKVILVDVDMAITPLKSTRKEKVGVFWKIQKKWSSLSKLVEKG